LVEQVVEDFLVFCQDDDVIVRGRDGVSRVRFLDTRKWRGQRGGQDVKGAVVQKAQMPGKVVKVLKQAGDRIEAGEGVMIIEAMKMQNEIKALKSGVVICCNFEEGRNVNSGETLFEIE
jgi:biotin carboxyl carrier protein